MPVATYAPCRPATVIFSFSSVMFSNDRNIEKVAKLVDLLKDYISLQKDSMKVSATEKLIKLLTVFILALVLGFVILLIVVFLSFAAAAWLETMMPRETAYLSVAAFYVLMFIVFYAKRTSWIQQPLVRIIANILTSE